MNREEKIKRLKETITIHKTFNRVFKLPNGWTETDKEFSK